MNRHSSGRCAYTITDIQNFKLKMLSWLRQFNIFCFLDSHDYQVNPTSYNCLVAAGVKFEIETDSLTDIDTFISGHHSWIFGHLSYELKNSIHHLKPSIEDKVGFPLMFFFVPEYIILLKGEEIIIHAEDPAAIYQEINSVTLGNSGHKESEIRFREELTKETYLEKIRQLKEHLHRGDCYEINFCQEFYAENAYIDPFQVHQQLMEISPNPFSAFYRLKDKYVICASPERFLSKKGSRIYSQPIKGTIRRNKEDVTEDAVLKNQLQQNQKERSENVMVVDMVRSDLGKICDSVKVEELFGIYTYPQVHQMISTISGELKKDISFSKIIEATFPMGSMTGAPKYRVMQLIDQYEESSRGIFSGSVGYITPTGDFDFNVVIRSIMYNSTTKYLSYKVGSGITIYCDAESEWEECLLKAEAIKKVLTNGPALQ